MTTSEGRALARQLDQQSNEASTPRRQWLAGAARFTVAATLGTLGLPLRGVLAAQSGSAAAFGPGGAFASGQLRIGLGTEPTTLDPHFFNLVVNSEIAYQIFDYLVSWDANEQFGPGLAESWSRPDDHTWEFRLRQGVVFQDGTPFSAEDVPFSFNRAANVPNSPQSFSQYTARIARAEPVDAQTLRITTRGPHPYLLSDLSQLAIVSRKIGANATTADYNSGKAAIGTGPYRLAGWVRGGRLELVRNERYWGAKPIWERVNIRPLTNPASRVSALLSGDVDVIDQVPTGDLKALARNSDVRASRATEPRLFYMQPDVQRDRSPFVTDKAGKPLDRNPLKDVRVRRAISKALNRQLLVDRVMDGVGVPAGQFVPQNFAGASPRLKAEPYDLAGAKQLMAQAGYPDGFGLTIHGPTDRYVNGVQILQAVAQMLTPLGIAVKVETMPQSIYFSRAANLEFSFMLMGSNAVIGLGAFSLERFMVHTHDPAKGMGVGNRGRYSSPQVDALIDQAALTLDDTKREAMLAQAADIAVGQDVAVITLFHGVNPWASRHDLSFTPRADGFTLASEAQPLV
jgi:peptide/nickel transport system substrate-binding protein